MNEGRTHSLPGDHNSSPGRGLRGPPLRRSRGGGGKNHSLPLDHNSFLDRAVRGPPR